MSKLKILYVGPESGTSRHRYNALRRLGHDVRLVDPFTAIEGWSRWKIWGFKTGYAGLEGKIERQVLAEAAGERFDVVWVDNGETVGRSLVKALKRNCKVIINHNLDNPFTRRDGWRWRLFLAALPEYDLFVTPRETSRIAALGLGAKRCLTLMQTADEDVHRRVELTDGEMRLFGSDVAFVGTWMPERGPFMLRLVERGVSVRIFGPRWTKAPEYPRLASNVVLSRHIEDDEYARVISGTKIALGLLSGGNDDLHTTRSLEIPAIGALFCAPRTVDHEKLYRAPEEALFFDSPDECADLCLTYLKDESGRASISAAGHARALRNGRFNERICAEIIAAL